MAFPLTLQNLLLGTGTGNAFACVAGARHAVAIWTLADLAAARDSIGFRLCSRPGSTARLGRRCGSRLLTATGAAFTNLT